MSSGCYAMPGLMRVLEAIPEGKKPYLVRGDIGFGSDGVMKELESGGYRYLSYTNTQSKVNEKSRTRRRRRTEAYVEATRTLTTKLTFD